ncbi:MAG: hypothetical protein GC184_14800 [Rhizobiales bacterium]|nr:hypothetical protein [Hyphomicrobiales bacterium]
MTDVAGYKAVGKLYNALMTGLVLALVSRKGSEAAADFIFGHFRRQHLEKFLPGLRKLGLDSLPDAVACAQYHYFSNALGGVKTEYMRESDEKAWVRYPPPRWIWQGTAICGIPAKVNEGMLHGWHGHNGVSLGNPRLGFVCTGQTVEGAPGLEGYYIDYGRDIAEHERVRFAPDEHMPDFDASLAPTLDMASWPETRLRKVERSYAMEYVRSLVPTMLSLFGEAETLSHLGHAARLIGLQFYEETALSLGITEPTPRAFGDYLAAMARAQGEDIMLDESSGIVTLHQSGWKLMKDIEVPAAAFAAWNRLWEGALAAHNRHLALTTERHADGIVWTIVKP